MPVPQHLPSQASGPSRSSFLCLLLLAACSAEHGDSGLGALHWGKPSGLGSESLEDRAQGAILPRAQGQGAFSVALPLAQTGLRFDAQGVRLGADSGADLRLQLLSWGRADAVQRVPAVSPTLSTCAEGCTPQLEYSYAAGLTAWWMPLEQGVEQGWTLRSAPPGQEPLVFDTLISGALAIEQQEDTLSILDSEGHIWTLGDVLAWDADGQSLATAYSLDGDVLRVWVDDSGARYPLTVDPLYTTATNTLTGAGTGTTFGVSVAGVGDVNGDGYDDVVIAATAYSLNTGRAFLYLGSSSGLGSSAATTFTGSGTGDRLGSCVVGAGDVNGDGLNDIAIGAVGTTSGVGKTYIYHGNATAVSSTASLTISGPASGSQFGFSVDGAGDVNADGYDDIIVGAPQFSSATGRATVYHGSATGLSSTAASTLNGTATAQTFGFSVSGAGDVNGDGYDDVVVGLPGHSSSTGRVQVFHGSSAGASTSASLTLTGSATGAYFGAAVAGTGDVNGDGYDDVAVGSYGVSSSTGQVTVYKGSSSGTSSSASWTLSGENTGDAFGAAVKEAGDINSDGYDDLAVGAYAYSSTTGRAYLFQGSAIGLPSSATTSITGGATSNSFGFSVAGAGDINGDGYGDLVVGAPLYSSSRGRAYTYLGYQDADGDGVAATTDCNDNDATIYPGGTEICDSLDTDEDCDGLTDNNDPSTTGKTTWYRDLDSDSYGGTTTTSACDAPTGYVGNSNDCNDSSAAINPSATELCDASNVDEDCNSLADNNDPSPSGTSTFYQDSDGDTYGDLSSPLATCDRPSGYSSNSTDCDDSQSSINPGTSELCDSANVDEDCDGLADDKDSGAVGGTLWYADSDTDTYGDPSSSATACDQPTGYVANKTDCDDSKSSINPAGSEVCDALNADEDCDGAADNNDSSATGGSTFYADSDSDTYGDASSTTVTCDRPSGYVTNSTDCDDSRSGVNPGATEVCDLSNRDEDCDSLSDDKDGSATGQTPWYTDSDSDGYGDSSKSTLACDVPTGRVADKTDCDDSSSSINPGATEICDSANTDEDCDGLADNNDSSSTGKTTWYTDADNDTYGDASSSTLACDRLTGTVSNDTDCDDGDFDINPGATELCDSGNVDEDCDSLADNKDPSATGKTSWYDDTDGDGFGDLSAPNLACDALTGTVASSTDCNDSDKTVYPGAQEVCDTSDTDQDCDGLADDDDPSATGQFTWYTDSDSDSFGDPSSSTLACDVPTGTVSNKSDCDDSDADIRPTASELCDDNDVDEDCDGLTDDADAGALGPSTWYADTDGDSYGDASATLDACDLPSGHVADATDCNDSVSGINPGELETCDDKDIDENCDGLADDSSAGSQLTWYADVDGDGHGDASSSTLACNLPSGFVAAGDDCDDTLSTVSPSAPELCDTNNTDEDCDGLSDDDDSSASGQFTWYSDDDSDGYGDPGKVLLTCDQPAGTSTLSGDCDDSDVLYNPAAEENDCADPNDYNCDGSVGYTNNDSDAFAACEECDDSDASIFPGAAEDCDGLDDDCDSSIDEGVTSTWYLDADADGFGDPSTPTEACSQPSFEHVSEAGDCDDADIRFNPSATEDDCADPNDYNCDGAVLYADEDQDGFAACEECDDQNNSISPDAPELCNDVDDNCDGAVDGAESEDASTWQADADGDGFTNPEISTTDCKPPDGFAAASELVDCDDQDPEVNPEASDSPDDGIDQDCDGADASGEDSGDSVISGGGGCKCSSSEAPTLPWWLGALALALVRRRRD